ncbi:hypothetical protein NDU88_003353 [Pleurodeles waltl]|uniref:Uncharacterized protein n=1 Tax=Pleurodeles waltl TaxID=8319 RepID=A0AAV7WUL0_PLEWA|nr:hypothetical protein NDU88_003353 [Pleurodeles waltl]
MQAAAQEVKDYGRKEHTMEEEEEEEEKEENFATCPELEGKENLLPLAKEPEVVMFSTGSAQEAVCLPITGLLGNWKKGKLQFVHSELRAKEEMAEA